MMAACEHRGDQAYNREDWPSTRWLHVCSRGRCSRYRGCLTHHPGPGQVYSAFWPHDRGMNAEDSEQQRVARTVADPNRQSLSGGAECFSERIGKNVLAAVASKLLSLPLSFPCLSVPHGFSCRAALATQAGSRARQCPDAFSQAALLGTSM